jgi:hypothetical protein
MSKKSTKPAVALTSGCIAGAIEATAVWPMEAMKIRAYLLALCCHVALLTRALWYNPAIMQYSL